VPQIFIGDTHVGGYDDMMALHRAGKLEPLLEGQAP
jgi:glutaredoxin 3